MPIFEMKVDEIVPLASTSFSAHGIRERADLQRLLRDRIEVAAPDLMVIDEEFGSWEDSKRRIDLLALDKSANLVVVELKRSEDRGATELQAIRYAAMISTMTFTQVVQAHSDYLAKRGFVQEAEDAILEFLEWESPDDAAFAQSVRIVLVAEGFSKELTTSVMWLNQRDLDIQCVRIEPYFLDNRILINVQQTIPLPEAAEYQIQIRKKTQQEQAAKLDERDRTRYDVNVGTDSHRDLPKRRAIFQIVRYLCESGVTPEQIAQVLPESERLWRSIVGEVDSDSFISINISNADAGGKSFAARRWFVQDSELIRQGGRTYAFTNQWGGGKAGFSILLNKLITTFNRNDISFEEHE